MHLKKKLSKDDLNSLRKLILKSAGKSVPVLIEVMKSEKYPDKSRWMATFLLGRIMGPKAAPFISKFIKHPNWLLRVASLKTLLALKQGHYGADFAGALKDKSLIVRKQALDNITKLSLVEYAPHVWAMLYDKRNYYRNGKKGGHLIKQAIKSIGKLKFEKARKPLLSMMQKDRYRSVFNEIDFSLSKIVGKKSPNGNLPIKRRFWKRVALMDKTL